MESKEQTEAEEVQGQAKGKTNIVANLVLPYSSAVEKGLCLPQASRDLLKQEVQEMAERLRQLAAQKQDLERRGIMLERLLKTKHEQAKILQDNKQVELVW